MHHYVNLYVQLLFMSSVQWNQSHLILGSTLKLRADSLWTADLRKWRQDLAGSFGTDCPAL